MWRYSRIAGIELSRTDIWEDLQAYGSITIVRIAATKSKLMLEQLRVGSAMRLACLQHPPQELPRGHANQNHHRNRKKHRDLAKSEISGGWSLTVQLGCSAPR
jgi:hypothetical protein